MYAKSNYVSGYGYIFKPCIELHILEVLDIRYINGVLINKYLKHYRWVKGKIYLLLELLSPLCSIRS